MRMMNAMTLMMIKMKLKSKRCNSSDTKATDAVHVEKGMGSTSIVSNCNMGNVENVNRGKKGDQLDPVPCSTDPLINGPTSHPSSGRSHVEANRRKIIYVELVSDPRRFVPQAMTRDIIYTVITQMHTPTKKCKNYSVTMNKLFKYFMDRY